MVSMAKNKRRPFTARLARWRIGIQASFLLLWLDPFLLRLHNVCSPVFHCYSCPLALFACPIGVLANFSALHLMPLLAIGTLLIFGGLFGSFICGWSCPFGFLQDLLARIPTPKFQAPAWLGHVRYAVLVGLVLAVPFFFGETHPLFFCRVCPAGAVEAALPYTVQTAIYSDQTMWPSAAKSVILVAFLVAALFMWRPWCTLFCPLGAIFGLCNRVSAIFLRFHSDRCNHCDVCRRLCHYGGRSESRAGELECVRCLDCTQCQAITVEHVFSDRNTDGPAPQAPHSSPPQQPG